MIQFLALGLSFVVLGAYVKGGRIFDWVNVLTFSAIGMASYLAGAYGALVLNVGFGLVGVFRLRRKNE